MYNRVSNSEKRVVLIIIKNISKPSMNLVKAKPESSLILKKGSSPYKNLEKKRNSNSTKSIWSHNGRFNQWSGVEMDWDNWVLDWMHGKEIF